FAGGTVVHINAGVAALAAAIIYGKRHNFGREPMEPHDVTMVVIGASLLWFGWFGFNAGSALTAGVSASNAFVVTHVATAGAMVVIGASLLWFGWFGFNAGSALTAGVSASNAFVVTHVATAGAMVAWVALSWMRQGKPSVVGAAAGAVAGLVAITPAAGFVTT